MVQAALMLCMASNCLAQPVSHSPHGEFAINYLPVAKANMTPDCTAYLVLERKGKEIARFPTIGEIQEVFWSPDGRYVAINNRRGESGDYLWVVATESGVVIHKPDDDLPIKDETKQFPEYAHLELHKEWIMPKGWKPNNSLWVRVDDIYSHSDEYLSIDIIYSVNGGALHLVSQVARMLPRF